MALDQQGVVIYRLRRGEKDGSVYGAIDFHGNDVPLSDIEKNALSGRNLPFTIYGGWAYFERAAVDNTIEAVNLNEVATREPVAFPSQLETHTYGATVDDRNGRMVALRVEDPHEEPGFFDSRLTTPFVVLREFLLPAEINDLNGSGSWVAGRKSNWHHESLLNVHHPADRLLFLTDNYCYVWAFNEDDDAFCYVVDLSLPRGVRNFGVNGLTKTTLGHLQGNRQDDFVFSYQHVGANNFAASSDNYFFVYDGDIWRGHGAQTFPLRGTRHRWVESNDNNLRIRATRWHVWGVNDSHQLKRWSLEDGSEETITPPGLGAVTHQIADIATYIPAGNKVWSYVTEPVSGQGDRVAPSAPATPDILSPGPNAVDDWTHWISLGWEFVFGTVFTAMQVQRRVVGSGDGGWFWLSFGGEGWVDETRVLTASRRDLNGLFNRFGIDPVDQGEAGVDYEFRFRFLGKDTQLWTGWTRTQRVNMAEFVEPPPAPGTISTTPYFARKSDRDQTFEVTIPDGQTAIEVWLQRRPSLLTQGWEFWSGEDQLWLASSRGETPEPAVTGAALTGEVAILIPAEWQPPDTTFYYSAYYRIAGEGAGKVSRTSPEREISTDPDEFPEAPTLTRPTSGAALNPLEPLRFSVWCPAGQSADGWWVIRKRLDYELGDTLWVWTAQGEWETTLGAFPFDRPANGQTEVNGVTTFEIELPGGDWADGMDDTYDYQVGYLSQRDQLQSEFSAAVRVTAQAELSPMETVGSLWVRGTDGDSRLYDWDFDLLPPHTVTDSFAAGRDTNDGYVSFVSNGEAFYHGNPNGTIYARNLTTGETRTVVNAGGFNLRGLVADVSHTNVYWLRHSAYLDLVHLLCAPLTNLATTLVVGSATRNDVSNASERAHRHENFAQRGLGWRPIALTETHAAIENYWVSLEASDTELYGTPIVTDTTFADRWYPKARDDGSRNFTTVGNEFWWFKSTALDSSDDPTHGIAVAPASNQISANDAPTGPIQGPMAFNVDVELGDYDLAASDSRAWLLTKTNDSTLHEQDRPRPGEIEIYEPRESDGFWSFTQDSEHDDTLGFTAESIVPVRPRGWNYATRDIERLPWPTVRKPTFARPTRDPSTRHPDDPLQLWFFIGLDQGWHRFIVARRLDGETGWEYGGLDRRNDPMSFAWSSDQEGGFQNRFSGTLATHPENGLVEVLLPAGQWGEDGRTYEFKGRFLTQTSAPSPYSDILHIEAFGRFRGFLPYAEIVRPRNNDDADGNNPLNLVVEIPYPHSVRSMLLKRTEVGGTTDEFWQAYSRDGTNGWVASEGGVTSWHAGGTNAEGQVTIPLPAGWQTNGTSYIYQVKYEGDFEGDRRQQAASGFSPEHTINAVEGAYSGSSAGGFDGPHAPTWVTEAGFHDTTDPLKLEWVFHPNGAHTTQHEVRVVSANEDDTAVGYWNGTAFVGDVSSVAQTANEITLPVGWQTNNTVRRYFVQVRAAAEDSWSPLSNALEIVTGNNTATLVSPTVGQTVGQLAQLNWTTDNQIAYQVVATRPWLPQSVLYDSDWVFGAERSARVELPREVSSGAVDLQVRVRDRFGRISAWAVARCTIDFDAVGPAITTVTAAEGDDAVRININFGLVNAVVYSVQRWQNFAAGTTQAALLDEAGVSDEERNRVYILAENVVPTAVEEVFYDRTARAGLPYAYRVRVVGSNERVSYSNWQTIRRPS